MDARLTKAAWRCQIYLSLTVLLLARPAAGESAPPPAPSTLRECVARAADLPAVAACEKREQVALKARITELSAAIRTRLDQRQRQVFDRNSDAWQAFLDSEVAMLGLSLSQRSDGVAPGLRASALTLMYEVRERQLREHLHNLSAVAPASPGGSR